MAKVIRETQDLTYLNWSHVRNSSGTAGTYLKSSSIIGGHKKYYKLSNFDLEKGIVGHECINEIIMDRLLDILGVEHLEYELINADIEIDGNIYNTYLCASYDFKERGESKSSLDDFYRLNAQPGESHYDFCIRMGWREYIENMLVIDYLILNRDRHGANIEVLRNARAHTVRVAPLFDHGLSLLCSCSSDDDAKKFDIMGDKQCNNFIGSRSTFENLSLLSAKGKTLKGILEAKHKEEIFKDLEGVLSDFFIDTIWDMIYGRYKVYENL